MVCFNSLGLFLSFGGLREMPERRCISFAIPFLIIPLSRPFSFMACVSLWIMRFRLNI